MERYDLKRKVEALQVVIDDHHKLVRELDVSLNGEDGAAKQASLCDLVSQIQALQRERDELKELTSVICGHCCEPMAIPSRAVLQAALDASGGRDEMTENAVVKDLGFVVAKLQRRPPGYERLLLMSPFDHEPDGTPIPAQSFTVGGIESLLKLHELLSVLVEQVTK